MGKFIDLTGHRYGRLSVLSRAENGTDKKAKWNVRCDCGTEKVVYGECLRKGTTVSCGCFNRERMSVLNRTHGLTHTRIYTVWRSMKYCCFNPNNENYHYYGGRGITVCDEWKDDFKAFYNWAIESGYKEEILPSGVNYWTLERIDNDGDFEPDNCCWANRAAQANNRQSNHLINYKGCDLTISQAAKEGNIDFNVLHYRITSPKKMTIEEAVETPVRTPPKYEYKGKYYSVKEIMENFHLDFKTFFRRLNMGMSIAEAIETKIEFPKYEYKGMEYTTYEIEKNFGINATTFRSRVKSGMSVEEAIDKEVIYQPKYVYNGVEYTAKQIEKEFGVSADTFRHRLKYGMTVQEAIETQKMKCSEYSYKGNTYSLTEICNKFNISKGVFLDRLKRWRSIEKAIETPKTIATRYNYKGKDYSLSEISKLFCINQMTFLNRMRRGMSVAEAIETPIKGKKNKAR